MPARRYLVSPQGGGPLRLVGLTLPAAIMGVAYLQDISTQASAGVPAYNPFTLIAQTGPDGWGVSVVGVITGTPVAPSVQITDDGTYIVDENGNAMVT